MSGTWTGGAIWIACRPIPPSIRVIAIPRILAAMTEQASRLTLTSRAFRNDQLAPFYEEICALTRSHKVLPMNSGAEAVESALKLARKWGYTDQGRAGGPGRDHRLRRQFPWPHHRHRRLLQRSRLA